MNMKVTVSLDFNTPAEAQAFLDRLNGELTAAKAVVSTQTVAPTKPTKKAPAEPEVVNVPPLDERGMPVEQKKVRAKPKAKGEPVQAIGDAQLKERAVTAMRTLYEKAGRETAVELLTRYGVTRFPDVPEDKYPEFIKDCEEAM